MPSIGVADEEAILDQLRVAVERGAQGKFDGADWSAEKIPCFFFGDDAGRPARRYFGSTSSPCSHFDTVLRDRPVMRAISRSLLCSRRCSRRIHPI